MSYIDTLPDDTLFRLARTSIARSLDPFLKPMMTKYEINTKLRVAHFLAQILHESDGLHTLEEYASGEAYEGREDLGNVHPGDGRKYKGRAPMQLTGGANYKRIGDEIGVDLYNHPERAIERKIAMEISCIYWRDHHCNKLADADDLVGVTHAVNGGTNGLAQRRSWLIDVKQFLTELEVGKLVDAFTVPLGATYLAEAVLYKGMPDDYHTSVTKLQLALRQRGWQLTIDGLFGAGTELAVKQFQHLAGLTTDGIVGSLTWEKLKTSEVGVPHP